MTMINPMAVEQWGLNQCRIQQPWFLHLPVLNVNFSSQKQKKPAGKPEVVVLVVDWLPKICRIPS